jgi:hypothetical protein
MKRRRILTVSMALVLWATASPVLADDTGFSSLHGKRRVGGKMCFVDHSHGGSSSGQRTRAAAVSAAVSSWYGYTAGEYGSDWANINKAINRRMACNQSSSGWGCDLDAIPCK